MLAGAIILAIVFILLLLLIAFDVLDRVVLALIAAMIAYFVVVFLEGHEGAIVFDLLFGTATEGYTNLHALILILGMMIIMQVCSEGGVFQFLAFRMVQMTKGKPMYLLAVFCFLTVFLTAIINDILTVMLLIPLTVTVTKILNIDPIPFIIMQAILVKIGASILLISSIPNILIAGYLGIEFGEFFIEFGILPIVVFGLTLILFELFIGRRSPPPRRGVEILLEFNVWNFVPDRSLMMKSIVVLIAVMIAFISIPSKIFPPDAIAMLGAVILLTISKLNVEELLKKIDFKLIIYLMGIFILTGAMETVGIIDFIATGVGSIASSDPFSTFLLALWVSAAFSAFIDNIPITKLLIPTVGKLSESLGTSDKIMAFTGMAYGVNWGDNLTPFGDTLIVVNVAEKNKVPFKLSTFFKIGFPTTIVQLVFVTIIYTIIYNTALGIVLMILFFIALFVVYALFTFKINRPDSKWSDVMKTLVLSIKHRLNREKPI